MIKKIWNVFMRDIKVSLTDFIALYIIVFPLLFAFAINAFVPSLNDTTVNLGFIESDGLDSDYFAQFAHVEVFDDRAALEERILRRDAFVGLVVADDNIEVLAQGNEPENIIEYAKILATYDEFDVQLADSATTIISLNRTTPPIKKILVNGALMFISVLGGMLILLNIIEEKVDNTISAVNVTPLSRAGFIVGKSAIGIIVPMVGALIMLVLTGFASVNFLQILLVLLSLSLLSIVIGLVMGLTNDDVMNAAGNMKAVFLPLMGSVAAIEMLGDTWQKFFYWIPFYWAYKANDIVLSQSDAWSKLLMYCGFVLALSAIVVALLAPRIRRGLE